MLQENVLVGFLRKFDQYPFDVVISGENIELV